MGVQALVRVGGSARPVAVGTGQQHPRRAALAQQTQQHQHAVAALRVGGGQPVIVDHRRVLVGAQVAGQDQRAGVGGIHVKAFCVREKRIVGRHKIRHKVGRDYHVGLRGCYSGTASLGSQAAAGGQHQHGLARKGLLQGG